ncbi:MAG TPA: hypothetical protein VFK59_10755 [Actinomycetota bacterium]|nr:hypothetical protein [Actinomycetota bacterium]
MAGCTGQGANQASTQPSPSPTAASEWSGGALAYARHGDIYVAEWDGSNPVKIADDRCEYWAEGPMWSPNGRYLAYRHDDCIPLNWPRDVVISDRAGNVITSIPAWGWGVSWSPDSTRVAVWDPLWKQIGIYGLDGVRQVRLKMPIGSETMGDTDPMWSPDGESILLAGGLSIPLDGSTPRLLPWLDREGSRQGFTYSPDGRRVALATDRSFVIAEADGSNPREVFWARPHGVVWSSAGGRIVFSRISQGSARLWMLDVATGTTTFVTEFDTRGYFPLIDFSPQGDRILFRRSRRDGTDWKSSLWSVNVDGSDLRRLVAGTGEGDWSPRLTGGGATSTANAIPPLPDGEVEPGRYVFTTFDSRLDDPYRISIDVLDGYEGFGGWAALKANATQAPVATESIDGIYTVPCGTGSLLTGSALASTDDVVAALANQDGLRVSAPTAVTVDGYAGTYLERTVPARTDIADCEKHRFVAYTMPLGGERTSTPVRSVSCGSSTSTSTAFRS